MARGEKEGKNHPGWHGEDGICPVQHGEKVRLEEESRGKKQRWAKDSGVSRLDWLRRRHGEYLDIF